MTRCLIPAALAALLLSAAAPAASAQFANVVRPAEPEAYAVRFGRDSAAPTPTALDSIRRVTRAELRAWVDSAAGALGVRLPLADSLAGPVADSLDPADSTLLRDTTARGIPLDSIRDRLLDPSRPPVSTDSLRRIPLPRARPDTGRRIPPPAPARRPDSVRPLDRDENGGRATAAPPARPAPAGHDHG